MTINGLHLDRCSLNHYHLIRRYQSALIVPCWKRRIFSLESKLLIIK